MSPDPIPTEDQAWSVFPAPSPNGGGTTMAVEPFAARLAELEHRIGEVAPAAGAEALLGRTLILLQQAADVAVDEAQRRATRCLSEADGEAEARLAAAEQRASELLGGAERRASELQAAADRQIAERWAESDRDLAARLAEAERQVQQRWAEVEGLVSDRWVEVEWEVSARLAETDRRVEERMAAADRMIDEWRAGWRKAFSAKLADANRRVEDRLNPAETTSPSEPPPRPIAAFDPGDTSKPGHPGHHGDTPNPADRLAAQVPMHELRLDDEATLTAVGESHDRLLALLEEQLRAGDPPPYGPHG